MRRSRVWPVAGQTGSKGHAGLDHRGREERGPQHDGKWVEADGHGQGGYTTLSLIPLENQQQKCIRVKIGTNTVLNYR